MAFRTNNLSILSTKINKLVDDTLKLIWSYGLDEQKNQFGIYYNNTVVVIKTQMLMEN